MKNVILSGFGIFGDYKSNLSQTVAELLDDRVVEGYRINSLIFSGQILEIDRGKALFNAARIIDAAGIISLGMASERKGICVETRARNLFRNRKYCPAELWGRPIDSSRMTAEELRMDLFAWNIAAFRSHCLEKGLAVEISEDCGGFCCNQLAYQARLFQIRALPQRTVPFIFLHIPCARQDVPDRVEFAQQGKVTMTAKSVMEGLGILLGRARL